MDAVSSALRRLERAAGIAPTSTITTTVSPDATPEERRELAIVFGNMWNAKGAALKMGFGVYNHPGHVHVHVDTGHDKRKWNFAKHYV